jgi:predicted GNAT superfamily acetyltransferase
LPACGELAERLLQLEKPEQIPPWFMHTTACYGGIAVGAFEHRRLVGYSYAVPGFDGVQPFLLSCGLAVTKAYASRGIGESLKLTQARLARKAGYDLVRWTTNSVASRPLYLYLSKLGARLVGYHDDMYAAFRDTVFPDEVEIAWDLRRDPRPPSRAPAVPLLATRGVGSGLRRVVALDTKELGALGAPAYSVELPWDRDALARRSVELAARWVATVRVAVHALLEAGYVGTAVQTDRSRERSLLRFERPKR